MNDSLQQIFNKLLQVLFILGFVCLFAIGAVLGYPRLRKVSGLSEERERINNRIQEKQREIAEIKAKQRRFNSDREFVESLARRDRRIFPGEIVFIFDD